MSNIDSNTLKKIQSWIIFVLVLVNIFAFLVISNLAHFRLDMTEGKYFSISKPTLELLNKLDNTMVIEYYYNDKCKEHPRMSGIVQYVEDLLYDYENSGRNLLSVMVKELNYDKDAAEIDELERLGIQPIYLSEQQQGESKSARGYSGIIIKYKNKQRVVPAVYQDVGFEYELDKEIKKVLNEKGTGIGLVFGIPALQFEKDFAYIKQVVESEHKTLTVINSGENIPEDIDRLIILGGSTLTDFDLFKIDQFLMNGGKAFVALNGVNVIINERYGIYGMANESKLFDLLNYYGITVNKDLVGDNDSFNFVVQQYNQHRYPIWPQVKSKNMKADHPVMSELNALNMFWPSSVDVDEKIQDNVEFLFHTTENSWAATGEFKLDFQTYRYPIQPNERAFNLACAFSGNLTSFYEGQDIPENENTEVAYTGSRLDSGETQLVVVGNESFLENNFTNEQALYFLMNSLDWMSVGEDSLTAIRSKGKFNRPLDKPLNKAEFAKSKTAIIAMATYVIPVIFIIIAVLLNLLRYFKNKDMRLRYKKS